jgi:DNA replication protein DnaC
VRHLRLERGEYVEAADLIAVAIEDKARYLKLRKASLVVLDELGTETADDKGYWQRTFNTLWNGWYAGCAKVIVTCNLSVEQFSTLYSERARDRLKERGRFLYIGGESLRRNPAKRQETDQ